MMWKEVEVDIYDEVPEGASWMAEYYKPHWEKQDADKNSDIPDEGSESAQAAGVNKDGVASKSDMRQD